jgi:hypothetical protein
LRAVPLSGKQLSAERLRAYLEQSLASEGLADVIKIEIELVDRILPDKAGKIRRAKNLIGPPPDETSQTTSRVVA